MKRLCSQNSVAMTQRFVFRVFCLHDTVGGGNRSKVWNSLSGLLMRTEYCLWVFRPQKKTRYWVEERLKITCAWVKQLSFFTIKTHLHFFADLLLFIIRQVQQSHICFQWKCFSQRKCSSPDSPHKFGLVFVGFIHLNVVHVQRAIAHFNVKICMYVLFQALCFRNKLEKKGLKTQETTFSLLLYRTDRNAQEFRCHWEQNSTSKVAPKRSQIQLRNRVFGGVAR